MLDPKDLKTLIWEPMALLPRRSEQGAEDVWDREAVDDTRVHDNWEDELRQAYEEGRAHSQIRAEALIRRVSDGLMTPEEADLEAERELNLTLSQPLRIFDLRAGHMYLWSPEMVAAWITWRRSLNVLRQYEPSYLDSKVWVENSVARSYRFSSTGRPGPELPLNGYQLCKLEKVSIGKRFLDTDGELRSFNPQWQDELAAAIVSKGIRSWGRDIQSGHETEIPATTWINGRLRDRDGERSFVANGSAEYHDIRFAAADVLKAFEPDYGVFRPWKRDPQDLTKRDWIAVKAFQKEWPHGFPWNWSRSERHEQVMNVLNAAAPRKFLYPGDNDAFKKFFERLADRALEEKVDSTLIL